MQHHEIMSLLTNLKLFYEQEREALTQKNMPWILENLDYKESLQHSLACVLEKWTTQGFDAWLNQQTKKTLSDTLSYIQALSQRNQKLFDTYYSSYERTLHNIYKIIQREEQKKNRTYTSKGAWPREKRLDMVQNVHVVQEDR